MSNEQSLSEKEARRWQPTPFLGHLAAIIRQDAEVILLPQAQAQEPRVNLEERRAQESPGAQARNYLRAERTDPVGGGEMIGVIWTEHVGPARRRAVEEENFSSSMADLVSPALESSERTRAEEALRESEEQPGQAQKMEAVARLAGGVAHGFNNLLMVMRGYSYLLLNRLHATNPLRRNAEEIQKATDVASDLLPPPPGERMERRRVRGAEPARNFPARDCTTSGRRVAALAGQLRVFRHFHFHHCGRLNAAHLPAMGTGASRSEILPSWGGGYSPDRSLGEKVRVWFCLNCQVRCYHKIENQELYCLLCGTLWGSYSPGKETSPGNGSGEHLPKARPRRRRSRRTVKPTGPPTRVRAGEFQPRRRAG